MSSKQKIAIKTTKKKLNRITILLVCIPGVILLGAFALWLNFYLGERKTLSELSIAGKNLEAVYNNLLAANPVIVTGSYFHYDCSVSHMSWLTQQISCGPHGDITLGEASRDIEEEVKVLAKAAEGTIFETKAQDISVSADSAEITTQAAGSKVPCYISYSKGSFDNTWGYSLVCRKVVPNFLPGYAVEK